MINTVPRLKRRKMKVASVNFITVQSICRNTSTQPHPTGSVDWSNKQSLLLYIKKCPMNFIMKTLCKINLYLINDVVFSNIMKIWSYLLFPPVSWCKHWSSLHSSLMWRSSSLILWLNMNLKETREREWFNDRNRADQRSEVKLNKDSQCEDDQRNIWTLIIRIQITEESNDSFQLEIKQKSMNESWLLIWSSVKLLKTVNTY